MNVLLGEGLINDKILFLKVSIFSEFLMLQYNLFHSTIVEGKKVFLKKPCFTFITVILLNFLVLYDILCVGMIKVLRRLRFKYFVKTAKFSIPTSLLKSLQN